jgi:hypothetical protein
MPYQLATGWDNETNFVTVTPPPFCPLGIQFAAYVEAISGIAYPEGDMFTVWEFEKLTEAQYESILTLMGLTAAATSVSAPVTIQTVTHDRSTFANYNARVVHKKGEDTEFADHLFRFARFRFKNLVVT